MSTKKKKSKSAIEALGARGRLHGATVLAKDIAVDVFKVVGGAGIAVKGFDGLKECASESISDKSAKEVVILSGKVAGNSAMLALGTAVSGSTMFDRVEQAALRAEEKIDEIKKRWAKKREAKAKAKSKTTKSKTKAKAKTSKRRKVA